MASFACVTTANLRTPSLLLPLSYSLSSANLRTQSPARPLTASQRITTVRSKVSTDETASQKNKKNVRVFGSEEEMAAEIAKHAADLAERVSRERGAFSVVLSGGSLVKSLSDSEFWVAKGLFGDNF